MSLTVLNASPAPSFVMPQQMTTACGGMATGAWAYQYAWQRARAIVAVQAWARFDPRSN